MKYSNEKYSEIPKEKINYKKIEKFVPKYEMIIVFSTLILALTFIISKF